MKKTFKVIGFSILSLILLVGFYFLSAYLLSRMSVEKEGGTSQEISIYILTNGVHTDLVVPVKINEIDWSDEVKFENTLSKDSDMQFLAFGWGDKGFYLETPTWGDLKFSTAFKAATGLSSSAIHTTYYKEMHENESCRKINISSTQYLRLVKYIKESFKTDSEGHIVHVKTNANYSDNDAFYEAIGSYSLFYTCNTWANNGLKSCGQKACRWTPFDTGIFYQYAKND